MSKRYRVEVFLPNVGWHFLQGSEGNRSFALGVFFGAYRASSGKRMATRVVSSDGEVIEEGPARASVGVSEMYRSDMEGDSSSPS